MYISNSGGILSMVSFSFYSVIEKAHTQRVERQKNMKRSNKKSARSEICEDFVDGEITAEKIEELQSKCKLFDPLKVSDQDISNLKEHIMSSFEAQRPLTINADSAKSKKRTAAANKGNFTDKTNDSINEPLLFKQFAAPPKKSFNKLNFVRHHIKLGSDDYERLFEWNIFKNITEQLMQTTFYQITQPQKNSFNSLQERLAASFRGQVALTLIDVIRELEEYMAAILVKVLVLDSRMILIFEWPDEPLFMFALCVESLHRRTDSASTIIVPFHRTDVCTFKETSPEEEAAKKDLIGPVETMATFYGIRFEVPAFQSIMTSPVALINYGYIKRDS